LDKLRLFVAADLPEDLKENIRGETACMPQEKDLKWVKPFQLHFTLKFLGYLEEEKASLVAGYIEKAARDCPPLFLRLEGCGAFPTPAKARVVWLGCKGDTEALSALALKLDHKMTKVGVEKEKRPFRAHLTLARCRNPRDVSGIIDNWQDWLAEREDLDFSVDAVILYRSILDASGPTYVKLGEFALRGER
jgi:2'-5' RNA ligase